jgi:hypothetical protein
MARCITGLTLILTERRRPLRDSQPGHVALASGASDFKWHGDAGAGSFAVIYTCVLPLQAAGARRIARRDRRKINGQMRYL